MLSHTFAATVVSALALAAGTAHLAQARPLLKPSEPKTIQCGAPLVSTNLTQVGHYVNLPVAFQGARDFFGRAELSTSLDGVAPSGEDLFEFVPCTSTVLPSGTTDFVVNYLRQYGQIRLKSDPSQCLTATALDNRDRPAPIVHADCQQADDAATLATQWWSALYYNGPNPSYQIHLVGHNQTGGTAGYYTFKSVGKKGLFQDAQLLETLFVPGSNDTSNESFPNDMAEEYTVLFNLPALRHAA
ncbi:hypothetical protein OC835_006138 [Tilletia horrida]|nr:hypothetical protein OC835_006138 [Tilletia horrida]